MKRLTVLLMMVMLLATGRPPAATRSAEAAGPLVLAFYYAWFDMNTWSSGQLADQPAQPYVSADAGTIDRHVSQAQGANIDGFVQSWYGPGGGNQTEGNFQTLLNIAAGRGFRAAVDFEVGSPYFGSNADRVAALQYLLASHANHPAYLRVDGKPVVFFWASWLLSVDDWANIRAQVDPNHSSLWIVEGASLDYLSVFDGLHLYNIAWSDNPAGTLGYWGAEVRARAALLGTPKYWAATVMPGWDDTHVIGRPDSFVRDRAGGAYYQACWSGAAASAPDMVVITSFNEWLEGSAIEPSVNYGDTYLGLTAQLAAAYKAGGVPAAPAVAPAATSGPTATLAPTEPPPPTYTPGPSPTPTESPTPRPSPTARPDGLIVHAVTEGDTLLGLADTYSVTLQALLDWNALSTESVLWIGQPLVVGKVAPTATPDASPSPSATGMGGGGGEGGSASGLPLPPTPTITPTATEGAGAVTVIAAPPAAPTAAPTAQATATAGMSTGEAESSGTGMALPIGVAAAAALLLAAGLARGWRRG